MHDAELSRFRHMLEKKRDDVQRLRHDLEDWSLGQSQKDALTELSVYDNHPADLGSELFFRSTDVAFKGEQEASLEAINRALERIADGTYGYCLRCGQAIAKERLQALPEAELCIDCQSRREQEESPDPHTRPLEEDVLNPPFGRTFHDDTDDVGFDGEDSWQAVARYGTSETPQDIQPDPPFNLKYPDVYTDADAPRGTAAAVEGLVDQAGAPLGGGQYDPHPARPRLRPEARAAHADEDEEENIRPWE